MHQAERGRVEDGPRPDRVRMQRLERSCPPRVDESEVERLESREVELERELAELRDKNAQLERFAAMAAHELLKPLIMTEAYATMMPSAAATGWTSTPGRTSTRSCASPRACGCSSRRC